MLPSCGPLHENDIDWPFSSTNSTRHEHNSGVSCRMLSVTAFGAGSEPKLLFATSSFQVPTPDACAAFVCANAVNEVSVTAATTRARIFMEAPFRCARLCVECCGM